MVAWLERDLIRAVADREEGTRPWIVAGGHHPMYSEGLVDPDMLAVLGPLLDKYQVDLFLTGHVHQYERNKPIFNNTVVDLATTFGTTHVMIGGAGNDEMPSGERRRAHASALKASLFSGKLAERKPPISDDIPTEDDRETLDSLGGDPENFTNPTTVYAEAWLAKRVPMADARGVAKTNANPDDSRPWGDIIEARDLTHYGIGMITADRSTLHFEYVQTTTGDVADEFTLTR